MSLAGLTVWWFGGGHRPQAPPTTNGRVRLNHSEQANMSIDIGGSKMERRTKIGIAILAVCTLLAGMVLGGLAGGGYGYYLARQQPSLVQSPVLAQPVA